VNTRLWSRQST